MAKILVLASFPAPYRVAVFSELAKIFKLDVFFGLAQDDNRNDQFFVNRDEFNYYLLGSEMDDKCFSKCVDVIESYDFVMGYDWYLPFARKVLRKCISKKIPYCINCDGAFIPDKVAIKNWPKEIAKYYYIKKATLCLASGEHAKRYFEHYGADSRNIYCHPFSSLHESDLTNVILHREEKDALLSRLGISSKRTVVSVGQFIPRKGYDVLLNAWRDLDEDNQLLIIGGGKEKKKYEHLIQEHGYTNVHLIDFVEKKKIFQYYAASDLFVLPTREDVWGLVINEAMAAGLPVISTTRCIAATELINDGVNGYIVPIDNSEELYSKMKTALEKDDLISMGKENQKRISEYTIENVAKGHIEVISNLLQEKTKNG